MGSSLISPGVSVPVIDQTLVTSAPTGTVPFIVISTAQNKINQSNIIAQYTTANTAGQLVLESSQRSLLNDFGTPLFQNVQGTPVNASEQNEYGLMTAFTTLGVTEAAYIMRAPIDLNALGGSLTAPTGNAPSETIWLDTSNSMWGIFQWNAATQIFQPILPTNTSGSGKLWVISSSAQTTQTLSPVFGNNFQPSSTIGKPSDYAVVTVNTNNPVWYMDYTGVWQLVGSASWQSSVPAVVGSVTNPVANGNLNLNGSNVSLSNANLQTIVSDITSAGISGVGAFAIGNRLALTANSSATNGAIVVGNLSTANVLTEIGIVAATYNAPAFQASSFVNVPQWNPTDSIPAPSGSVWFNTSSQQGGANISVKEFNGTNWILDTVTIASDDAHAIYALDATGGGINIPAGTFYLETGVFKPDFASVLLERISGPTTITASNTAPVLSSVNYSFEINSTEPSNQNFIGNVTVSFNGPNIANLVNAINSLSISGLESGVSSTGAVYITNTNGGTFYLYDGTNTPLSTLGFNLSSIFNKVSNWVVPTYVVSSSTPTSNPVEGTLWYYDDPSQADILVNTGSAWASYRTVTANLEARGYNLTLTDPNGPIASASAPTAQSTGSPLAYGDLWLNTSDLNTLPNIYRYSTGNVWTQINTTDHTSPNGIIFADARWSTAANVDPGTGILTPISILVNASPTILDSDAPAYELYPRGTLLFNTRRSGMNVKQFQTNYLTNETYTDTWVTASGNNSQGVAYQGSAAQRNMVVQSMISAITNSTQLQDEFYNFNLMAAPGYPELLPTLVNLNQARGETAFIVSDSPLTLAANSNTLNTWANNLNGATTDGVNGLVTFYDYAATYYPSASATDTNGNVIVVPSSYMTLPTIINSDAVSFPWFAPAGPRRGVVTNVNSIGYVDAQTGNFVTNSVSKSLRDVLYPAAVNPITNFNTNGGIEIYGQKTRSGVIGSELTRINVARLVIYLRGALAQIARGFVFEQNDSITRQTISYQIGQFLNTIQSNRGISDYVVVSDLTNNPPSVVDANQLYVDVAIAPTTVSEFIYIPLTLTASGVITTSSVTAA